MVRKKKNFVDPSRYGVMIPYSDFAEMVKIIEKYGETEERCERLESMYQALKSQYLELLLLLRDMDRRYID